MCHVLIIEDDAVVALDIQRTLELAGATSFSFAVTKAEALRSAEADRPAVITADVMLGSDSGVETVRSLEALLGPIPVIFITGTPDQCVAYQPHPVIGKPFNTEVLAQTFLGMAPPL